MFENVDVRDLLEAITLWKDCVDSFERLSSQRFNRRDVDDVIFEALTQTVDVPKRLQPYFLMWGSEHTHAVFTYQESELLSQLFDFFDERLNQSTSSFSFSRMLSTFYGDVHPDLLLMMSSLYRAQASKEVDDGKCS